MRYLAIIRTECGTFVTKLRTDDLKSMKAWIRSHSGRYPQTVIIEHRPSGRTQIFTLKTNRLYR